MAVFFGVLGSVSVVGLSLGFIIPLISVVLEQRGLDSTLIGLMAALPAFGTLVFASLIAFVVRHLGAQYTINMAIGLTADTMRIWN